MPGFALAPTLNLNLTLALNLALTLALVLLLIRIDDYPHPGVPYRLPTAYTWTDHGDSLGLSVSEEKQPWRCWSHA